jgi:hypothetical protein
MLALIFRGLLVNAVLFLTLHDMLTTSRFKFISDLETSIAIVIDVSVIIT